VSDIYGEKKKLKQELKDYYDKSQTKLKELEQQAQVLQEEFEKWKKTQTDDQKSLTKAK
jgi:septal ring factor EnvC (AmiA/AmiB activator)